MEVNKDPLSLCIKEWFSLTENLTLTTTGFLINLFCKLHSGPERGFLSFNGSPPTLAEVATSLRMRTKTVEKQLNILEAERILYKDERGIYYNPRMVKAHKIREQRKSAGKAGGLKRQEAIREKLKQNKEEDVKVSEGLPNQDTGKNRDFIFSDIVEIKENRYLHLCREFGKDRVHYAIKALTKLKKSNEIQSSNNDYELIENSLKKT